MTRIPHPLPLLLLMLLFPGSAHAAVGDLLWSDEFNVTGPPDSRYWDYDLGGGGWGNWEYQDYTNSTENAIVEADGALKIRALRTSDTTWTSARLKTAGRLYVKYGTIEARIQIPDLRNGLWAAFWTLGQNFATEQVPWPHCGELDVLEMGWARAIASGVANQRVLSAVHYGTDRNVEDPHGHRIGYNTSSYTLNTDYHIYRLEWTPTSVRVTLDDKYQTLYVPPSFFAACGDDCSELHQPHYLLLNLAVGGGFTQLETDYNDARRITATFPATMAVDYVRIYDNGFTELSGTAVLTVPSSTTAPVQVAPTTPTGGVAPSILDLLSPRPAKTNAPARAPVVMTEAPVTMAPTTRAPTTAEPTKQPTRAPTKQPTLAPTKQPTLAPSKQPTLAPTTTNAPSLRPTMTPTSSRAPTTPNVFDKPNITTAAPAMSNSSSDPSGGGGGGVAPLQDNSASAFHPGAPRHLWTVIAVVVGTILSFTVV